VAEILPGEELIETGLHDLAAGRETVEALLVAVGAPRLRRIGVDVPASLPRDPDHRLYELLEERDAEGAYGRYNALLRTLSSFARAAECVGR
jgi:hypothetical protein